MNTYLMKRPFRKSRASNKHHKMLIEIMRKRFQQPFENYWEQFGYEIGGPLCFSYVTWIMNKLEEEQDISSIAFVARDGWLLKKTYEKIARDSSLIARYVYAPRSIYMLSQGELGKEQYASYLKELGMDNGTIAVVDSITLNFSSQRLISDEGNRETIGFFWLTLPSIENFGHKFRHHTFQEEQYHTIKNWNFVEFILTSPEPPIEALRNGEPVYSNTTEAERFRQSIFPFIEKGVLAFVDDVVRENKHLHLPNKVITEWVNDYLANPSEEDIVEFQDIFFSERSDHSDSIPLDPFGIGKKRTLKEYKDRLWFWSIGHPKVYAVLHTGKSVLKWMLQRVQSRGIPIFDGQNIKTVLDLMTGVDVVSFDIFDTLLLRPYKKPTDLFFELEQKNGFEGFHDSRVKAEQLARKTSGKTNGEINLSDIYHVIEIQKGQSASMMEEQEILAEMDACYANPCFLALTSELERKGVSMVATSDMYLSAEVLRRLLDMNGYSMIRHIFVSNEYGAGKYDGSLQNIVWDTLGREKNILHIGDNFYSDAKQSLRIGWEAIWYCRNGSN